MTKKLISIWLVAVTLLSVFLFAVPAYATGASETLRIVAQPCDICVPLGEMATVTVKAEGKELEYQWFYKDRDDSSFSKAFADTTETYATKMEVFRDGREVYCVIKDRFGNQTISDTVTLSAKAAIIKQPKPAKAYKGSDATVTIEAVGDSLTYVWYYKQLGDDAFQKSMHCDGNVYTLNMNSRRNGCRVYCEVTDKYGNTAKTNVVSLAIDKSVRITEQPEPVISAEGETVAVSVQAAGEGLEYTWYRQNVNESAFQKVDDISGDTYTAVMNPDTSGCRIYCEITDRYGNLVQTDIVAIAMEEQAVTLKDRVQHIVRIGKGILYSLAIFALLIIALKKRDSKKLFNVIMVLCWIVIALSLDSRDIGNYWHAYDMGYLRGKEPFFDVLQNTFASAKIPFSVFKLMYGTVIWVLLYKALKNYTADMALAAILFVLGPMMGFGTQMRSSMAGVLVLNAMPYLLKKDGETWKYCAWVAVASLVHLMAAFYIIFLIPKYLRWDTRKFRNVLFVMAVVLIPCVAVFMFVASKALMVLQNMIGNPAGLNVLIRLSKYFSGEMSPNLTGFLYAACAHLVVFFVTDRMCGAMLHLRREDKGEKTVLSSYAVEYLCKLNSIMALIVPCYVLSMQFDRVLNYFLPVCYCLIAQGTREVRAFKKTEDGATYRIMQAGDNKLLCTIECFVWKIVDSKAVIRLRKALDRVKLGGILEGGNIEMLLLLACMIFCFFVSNRYTADSEFIRIINGIGRMGG